MVIWILSIRSWDINPSPNITRKENHIQIGSYNPVKLQEFKSQQDSTLRRLLINFAWLYKSKLQTIAFVQLQVCQSQLSPRPLSWLPANFLFLWFSALSSFLFFLMHPMLIFSKLVNLRRYIILGTQYQTLEIWSKKTLLLCLASFPTAKTWTGMPQVDAPMDCWWLISLVRMCSCMYMCVFVFTSV